MARRKYTVARFQVEGSNMFPTDMLRYDACYPASESDSGVIDAANRYDDGPHRVNLRSHAEAVILNGPKAERWASFGWKIVPGSWERE